MKKKNFCTVLALAFFIMSAERVSAQVTIGDNKTPETFSQLEIVSGNKTGLRLPQITTTAQRDAMFTNTAGFKTNPLSKGLQIFNEETGCVETWNGTKWIRWCDDASGGGEVCTVAPAAPGAISGIPSSAINSGATFTATISAVTGATSYVWTLPAGLTGTSTTNSIIITGATAGTYAAGTIKVVAVNACGTSAISNSTTAVTINNAIIGCTLNTVGGGSLTFMNYNLGAKENVQTMTAEEQAAHETPKDNYGDLYQWGRPTDGHQFRTSGTTSTLATSNTPNHADFILATSSPYDWRSGGGNDDRWGNGTKTANDPCPAGWRVPSATELRSIANGNTSMFNAGSTTSGNYWEWNSGGTPGWLIYPNTSGTGAPTLFLPAAGFRNFSSGLLVNVGTLGYYYSSSVNGTPAYNLNFDSSTVSQGGSANRGCGMSVRCVAE